ncbi:MAG: restriction endonuclease subunit S [Blastomonas sp.]|uniref:restriction endonuclease subunit S n=1 Tax=Blastomonas sp. TaxID=1909299 RepID=UPI00258A39EE|nr:restriction endonuclease subunit S [Blastomonas sp.]MCO5792077.1 restriction endonuclease subunit S [Blastomonas sp.]
MSAASSLATELVATSAWQSRFLGEIVDILDSKRRPITKRDRVAGPYPYYGATGVLDWVSGFIFDEPLVLIGEDGAKWGAGDRSAFAVNGKTWVNNHAHVLRPHRQFVMDEWLIYYLNAADITEFISGMTVPKLNQGRLREIPIPVPPLEEQKRIVTLLDQAFAALDRARALAEANLGDAEEVWSRKLDELFNPDPGLPVKSIGDIASIQSGAGFPNKEQGSKSGAYPFYKVSDMNLPGNERRLVTANNYIDEPARKRLRAAIFPRGSIVFPKVGGAIATNKKRIMETEGCVDNNVMGLIPDERVVVPEYLHEWLFATDIYEFSNKANPPSITQGTVKDWPFFCPDIATQQRVVDLVQTMRNRITALSDHYRRTVADVGELRQSVLQKAFAGELT